MSYPKTCVATRDDVDKVLADLSDQTLRELEIAGTDPEALRQSAYVEVDAGGAYAMVSGEGDPWIVFGFNDYDHYFSMWSFSAKGYWTPAGIRASKRFFQRLQLQQPLIIRTASDRDDVEKWMNLLGFELKRYIGTDRVFTLRRERSM